ncbi:MAG: M28 family metallopeptidase, partial [Planctomycetota bacterium]|nr:M28 family metallopeptidase [Planctomycetota bacterium]
GANDDASGTAAALEACRVLSGMEFDHTLVFVAFDAEEAGLYGARAHVAGLAGGARVRAGRPPASVGAPPSPAGQLGSSGLERLRREGALGDSSSRQLARFVCDAAETVGTRVRPTMVWRADRFLRGGDHTPFHEAGFAAVRFTEVDEDYSRQHQDVRIENGVQYGDLPEFVDERYLADVTRLNVAAAVLLADGPGTPGSARLVTAELSNNTTVRWSAAADPDVAGYEVVWRETTSAAWQGARDVGMALEARLPLSKDRYFFGVRAYDREGNRGLVGFALAARE